MTDRLRILGIDPGSRLTGFGVLDCVEDSASYVASGAVNTIEGEWFEILSVFPWPSYREVAAAYYDALYAFNLDESPVADSACGASVARRWA